jgi:nucleoside-diphosphate-sugar epimerase
VVHGDGNTLWTLTHSSDFARAILEFLKSGHAPGESFHITSYETYTWNEITHLVCREIGVSDPKILYRTVEEIDGVAPRYGNGIKYHKRWNDVYDNDKFRSICPSWRAMVSLDDGIKESVDYYRRHPQLMVANEQLNAVLDAICNGHGSVASNATA